MHGTLGYRFGRQRGFIYGIVLLLTNPAIPNGAIAKAFGDALTLDLKNESMTWFENIRLSNFQTYVSVMCDSGHWRIVWYTYIGVCAIQLLLRNGWMHTKLLRHRIFCPIMTCLLSFSLLPVALLAGSGDVAVERLAEVVLNQ